VTKIECEIVGESGRTNTSETGSSQVVFHGLTAAKPYSFQCLAVNVAGSSAWGTASQLTTARTLPTPPRLSCLVPQDGSIQALIEKMLPDSRVGSKLALACGSAAVPGQSFSGLSMGDVLEASITGLANGVKVQLWCEYHVEAGTVRSEFSIPIVPGIPLQSTYRLEGSQTSDEMVLRQYVAEVLRIDVSRVVADVLRNQFDGCVNGEVDISTRRLAQPLDFRLQVKVMLQSGRDADAPDLIRGLNALTTASGSFANMTQATVIMIEPPQVLSPTFMDSSLRKLSVLSDGEVASRLVPAFAPDIFVYAVNVTSLQYTMVALANSLFALPVKVDGASLTVKDSFEVVETAPASRLIVVGVTAGDLTTSSSYMVRVFFQPVRCAGSCGNGTCNSLTAQCECDDGYTGDQCQAYCPGTTECHGRGTCNLQTGSCNCQETFAGPECATRTCPACQHGGACVPGEQSVSGNWGCSCGPKHHGPRCEDHGCPSDCSGSGDCNIRTGNCTCYVGFDGEDCAIELPKLVPLIQTVQVSLIWGISGSEQVDERREPIYRDDFDFDDGITQQSLLNICMMAKAEQTLLTRSESPCVMELFAATGQAEGGFPVPADRRASVLEHMFGNEGTASSNDIGTLGPGLGGPVRYVRQRFRLNLLKTAGAQKLMPVYERWQKFLDAMHEALHAQELGGKGLETVMVSKEFNLMHVEQTIIQSSVYALVSAVGIVLLSVVVFTGNVVVAAYAVLSVLLSIGALFGILISVLQWEFGPVQAIALTTFLGLSVDYTLHLCHAYHHAEMATRRDRVQMSLGAFGPAILGGGLTTAGSALFCMPCWIYLFVQLGIMLFMNTILSLTFTFLFLAPLLSVCGPTGDTGQIHTILLCRPCRRRCVKVDDAWSLMKNATRSRTGQDLDDVRI